jgi:iron complex outermembrane recepter protein
MNIKYNISTLICLLYSVVSLSQEVKTVTTDSLKEKTINLNEVIVTGSIKKDPVFSVVANQYSKKVVQPKNVADLFNDLNGFSVIKRGNYAIDPSFRAAQYEQLNVQYDGGTKVMHACPNRMDPITTHVIPEEISKIEIVKGPYTMRYGATFGGIVNLVTHKPQLNNLGWHGKVSAGYESNGDNLVNRVELGHVSEKFDLTGNFGYRDFGNYKDGDGTTIPSSFRSIDYGFKMGYNFSENERLQANWRQSFGRDVLHAALPMDTDYDNSTMLSLDYSKRYISSKINALTAKAYYSYVDHLMSNKLRPSFMMSEAEAAVDAITLGGKFELEWQPAEKLVVFTGIDALHIARDGFRDRLVKIVNGNVLPEPRSFTDKIWQDSYITNLGVFTETKYELNKSTNFTFGLRYDHVVSEIQDPDESFAALYDLEKRTEHNFSGTLSVKKQLSETAVLQAAYGRGVRSANMIERFISSFNVGQDPYEYIGNPNLKAEVNNQFEIGFLGNEPLNSGLNSFKYEASFYYAFFENYIVALVDTTKIRKFSPTTPPVNPKVFRNLDAAYKTGFEIMAQLDFLDDYYVKSEMAYVYTKNKDLQESLPLTAPFTSAFTFGFEREKYWANLRFNVVSQQNNIAPSFDEIVTNGYETVDLRFGVIPFKNLNLGFAALNIFDVTYNNHLNFAFTNQANFGRTPITDPGRNLSVFVQYSF